MPQICAVISVSRTDFSNITESIKEGNFPWGLLDRSKTGCSEQHKDHSPCCNQALGRRKGTPPDLLRLHDALFVSLQPSRQALLVKAHTLLILQGTGMFKSLCILFSNVNIARIKAIQKYFFHICEDNLYFRWFLIWAASIEHRAIGSSS